MRKVIMLGILLAVMGWSTVMLAASSSSTIGAALWSGKWSGKMMPMVSLQGRLSEAVRLESDLIRVDDPVTIFDGRLLIGDTWGVFKGLELTHSTNPYVDAWAISYGVWMEYGIMRALAGVIRAPHTEPYITYDVRGRLNIGSVVLESGIRDNLGLRENPMPFALLGLSW